MNVSEESLTKILDARDRTIAELRAELAVRTHSPGFPSRPESCRKHGVQSAFDSGYEEAWRGHLYKNSYTRPDVVKAYLAGYTQGAAESAAEIKKYLETK